MRVFVIDDSKVVRVMLKKILGEIGFNEVFEACNGREALERLPQIVPIDLMLVDIHMPEMDGFEFLENIRSHPFYNGVRIMMVTSETEMEQVQKALQDGANEYIMKPFSHEGLQEKLALLGLITR